MIREYQLRVLPREAAQEDSLKQTLSREAGIDISRITALQIIKQSIDARQRQIYIQLKVRVFIDEQPVTELFENISYASVSSASSAVVVGAGPAGLFAALRLIELGIKPLLIERGQPVEQRKRDLAQSLREQRIEAESNYCFGEGGAGAFSDGKLYTRSKKRGDVDRILRLFCQFGAADVILKDAHPHIGSDKLPGIISSMRKQILQSGGEVYFGHKMEALLLQNNKVCGIRCSNGREFPGPVILATGHSARDVYRMLHGQGIQLAAKGFAMGVRLEHPQSLIDELMYHSPEGRGEYLPAAEYNFVTQVGGRGVYSFCMCPGGFVVPAAQDQGLSVVNGMSPAARNSAWANSGMVVEIRPEDAVEYKELLPPGIKADETLALLHLQEALEKRCYNLAGEGLKAPAQRMDDFVRGRTSANLPASSYLPGLKAANLHEALPRAISSRLQEAFIQFDKKIKGFLSNEAQLIACESRSSSPLRMPREAEGLNYIGIEGLYPCGEGAGYSGGIVSSAIDGERCAEALSLSLTK
jgi:uncharacterized FAD-dependent dehydrogenase